jgi:hypothetical protein
MTYTPQHCLSDPGVGSCAATFLTATGEADCIAAATQWGTATARQDCQEAKCNTWCEMGNTECGGSSVCDYKCLNPSGVRRLDVFFKVI